MKTRLLSLALLLALPHAAASAGEETETVFFTVPTVFEAVTPKKGEPPVPGPVLIESGVWSLGSSGVQTLASVDGTGSIGLAQGPDDALYVGVITQTGPLIVALDRIDPGGEVTRIGTLADTTDAVFSIFGRGFDLAWGPDGWIYYTTPRLFSASEPGIVVGSAGVRKINPTTGESVEVIAVDANATAGLGFAPDGTLWFGVLTSEFPVRISLFSLDQAEVLTDHGIIFDTTGGLILLNGFTFDVAPGDDGGVYFTTTTVFDPTFQPLMPASIRRFDIGGGDIETIVVPGSDLVAGLALGEDGRMWFGTAPSVVPLVFEIARTDGDGIVDVLGTAFDTADGLFSLTDQGLDLAVAPHAVLQYLALLCPADLDADGTVGPEDLSVLLGAWGVAGGAAADLDADGDVGSADLAILLAAWGTCP